MNWLTVLNNKGQDVKIAWKAGDQNRTIQDLVNLGRFQPVGNKIELEVPNVVMSYWGGNVGKVGQWWVAWNKSRQAIASKGFMVPEYGMGKQGWYKFKTRFDLDVHVPMKADQFFNLMKQAADQKMLYGLYIWGHGVYAINEKTKEKAAVGFNMDGGLVNAIMGFLVTTKGPGPYDFLYSRLNPKMDGMTYRLGMGLFFFCGGGAGKAYLSSNPIFYGVPDILVPFGKLNPLTWLNSEVETILKDQFKE
jgi:hypothetical protein